MFSRKSGQLLAAMRIDPLCYYNELFNKFGSDVHYFVKLIEYFDSSCKSNDKQRFLAFCAQFNLNTESELFNWLYEFYNNLSRYFKDGVFGLFKQRQAEWGAPRVTILRTDVPQISDVSTLGTLVQVYRGLSVEEHQSKNYAQSWTIDPKVAERFANEIYSDQQNGIVVTTQVYRSNILYFDSQDSEQETIIEAGVITSAEQTLSIKESK